ncbi:MAG: hypothetical protein AAGF47_04440 [Planctomycetota bacterium]
MNLTLANAGLPMIVVWVPGLFLAFIPIVLAEATVYRLLHKGEIVRWLARVSAANVASTLLGVPLTWLALVILQMNTGGGGALPLDTTIDRLIATVLHSPWVVPYQHDLHWLFPAAGLFLTLPFLIVSVMLEHLVIRWMAQSHGDDTTRLTRATAWLANGITYFGVASLWSLGLYIAVGAA